MTSSKNSLVYKTVPKSWEIKRVKELSTLNKNAVQTGPFGSLLHSSDYVESGIPLILVRNIKNGKIDVRNIPHVTEKDANRLAKFRVKEGDIVFSRVGRVGSSALIEKEHEGWLISGQTLRIRFDNPKINPKYINYFFQSGVFSDILSKEILGMTRDSINTSILEKISVLIPTLSEQERIIIIISNIDNLLKKCDSIIDLNKCLKMGLIQQLLTKGIGHKKFKKINWLFDKEIKIPEVWMFEKILENSTLKGRIGWQGLTTAEYRQEGKFYLVTGTDFKNGRIDWDNCVYVDKERFDQDENIQLKSGDVLVTKDGTIGKIAYVDNIQIPSTLNTGVFVIRPLNKKYFPLFLFYVLYSDYFNKFLNKLKAGSTINHLYQSDFVDFSFPIPPYPEQQKIASILLNIDYKISELELKKVSLENFKKSLMQKLLTGKIRVTI